MLFSKQKLNPTSVSNEQFLLYVVPFVVCGASSAEEPSFRDLVSGPKFYLQNGPVLRARCTYL